MTWRERLKKLTSRTPHRAEAPHFEVESEATQNSGHTANVWSVRFSQDGTRAVTGSEDGTIRLWDVSRGVTTHVLENTLAEYSKNYPVYAVRFSHSGKVVVSGGNDYAIKMWDAQNGRLIRLFSKHYCVTALDLSRDGTLLVSGNRDCLNMDCCIKLWDLHSGKEIRSIEGLSGIVLATAFSPDGKLVASGGTDSTVKLWKTSDGKLENGLECKDMVRCVAWSPDGRYLAAGGHLSRVSLWDVEAANQIASLGGHTGAVCSVCFSADGERLASADEHGTVKSWDSASGRELASYGGQGAMIACALSKDGRETWSANNDWTPRFYRF